MRVEISVGFAPLTPAMLMIMGESPTVNPIEIGVAGQVEGGVEKPGMSDPMNRVYHARQFSARCEIGQEDALAR